MHHHHGTTARLHLPVTHVGAHAVTLHGLPSELRHASHWHLSHLTVVKTGHLRVSIAWTVLNAVAVATRKLHPRVEVLSVAMLAAVLWHVGEALRDLVPHVGRLQVGRELVGMRHWAICWVWRLQW